MNSSIQPGPGLVQAEFGDVLDPIFVGYLAYESTAMSLRSYQAHVVHGLLQTREYNLSLNQATAESGIPQAAIERGMQARQARQAILGQDDGPLLHFIMGEAALVRPTEPGEAGERILRGQLERLAELDSYPRITIQILPFWAGAYRGMSGSFTILELRQHLRYQQLVYRERTEDSTISTDSDSIKTHLKWFNNLSQAATSLREVTERIGGSGERSENDGRTA